MPLIKFRPACIRSLDQIHLEASVFLTAKLEIKKAIRVHNIVTLLAPRKNEIVVPSSPTSRPQGRPCQDERKAAGVLAFTRHTSSTVVNNTASCEDVEVFRIGFDHEQAARTKCFGRSCFLGERPSYSGGHSATPGRMIQSMCKALFDNRVTKCVPRVYRKRGLDFFDHHSKGYIVGDDAKFRKTELC
ncbi:hypothetical protein FKW77_002565 [Venturia effusa]|uniref:Uncharacterized protein n=1 Tax=Venturia effusa TaxID=50376 RepID=A0A517LAJ1_9PEZI|nr:hypothetical protein FKW77_002565 [Venturia effusa]